MRGPLLLHCFSHLLALSQVAHFDFLEPVSSKDQPDRFGVCRGRHQEEDRAQEESFHAVSVACGNSVCADRGGRLCPALLGV